MRHFLDTSVLVAAFLGDHEHHERSVVLLLALNKRTGACAAHSLTEFYATVTRLPGKFRVTGEQAMLFLGQIRERLNLVALDAAEYGELLADAAATGVAGGAIYDALIAGCAKKARATSLITMNIRHFAPLSLPSTMAVRTP